MIRKIAFMHILLLMFLSAAAEGADWLNLIQNEKGENQYIDIESIEKLSSGVFRVSRKTERNDPSGPSYVVSQLELDCEKKSVKVMEETSYDKTGTASTSKGDGRYKEIGPDDIEETMMELVCSLKKAR